MVRGKARVGFYAKIFLAYIFVSAKIFSYMFRDLDSFNLGLTHYFDWFEFVSELPERKPLSPLWDIMTMVTMIVTCCDIREPVMM